MASDYQPIACEQHERLEFAVLRKIPLHLTLTDGREMMVHPLDVFTSDDAEWLRFKTDDGMEGVMRLDQIASLEERPELGMQ